LRQAYDYWQDQPGFNRRSALSSGGAGLAAGPPVLQRASRDAQRARGGHRRATHKRSGGGVLLRRQPPARSASRGDCVNSCATRARRRRRREAADRAARGAVPMGFTRNLALGGPGAVARQGLSEQRGETRPQARAFDAQLRARAQALQLYSRRAGWCD